MITNAGILIQIPVDQISILGRIASGVKLIDLEKGIKVAKIAKVREKVSNGEQEFENLEDAMEEIEESEAFADEDGKEVMLPKEDESEE